MTAAGTAMMKPGFDYSQPLADQPFDGRMRCARIYGMGRSGIEVQADGPMSPGEAWLFGWNLMQAAEARGYRPALELKQTGKEEDR